MDWFTSLAPTVQVAIITITGVFVNIVVTCFALLLSYINNKQNIKLGNEKLQLEIDNSIKHEGGKLIDHQLKIVSEIKEKKDYFSSMIKICYQINGIHGSATDYQENLGLGLSEKTLNTEWIKKDYAKIENLLSDLDFYISKSFNFIGERDAGKKFVWIQKHNYDYFYNKVLSEYFLNNSEGKISNPKSAKICQYIHQIYNNNIQFIGFIDDCLSGCIKNLGLNAENDMNYLIGRYPLRMEIGKETFKNTQEEMLAVEKWGALNSLAITNIDFNGYMDYVHEEKIEDFREHINKLEFEKAGDDLYGWFEYFEITDVLEGLSLMDQNGSTFWLDYKKWFEMLEYYAENHSRFECVLLEKVSSLVPDFILEEILIHSNEFSQENIYHYNLIGKVFKFFPQLYKRFVDLKSISGYHYKDQRERVKFSIDKISTPY